MKSGFTWRRGVEEDSEEPSDLEQDQAAKTNPRPPKKQRTADGLSGSATQPGSAKGGNGAVAAFCLRCVRRMSNGTFGENPSLKQPCGGPPPCPACGQKKGSDNVIGDHPDANSTLISLLSDMHAAQEAYVESLKAAWEDDITLDLEGPVAPVSDKVCVDLGTEEGREADAWVTKAESQDLRASASKVCQPILPHARSAYQLTPSTKARKAAMDFATRWMRYHNASRDVRSSASVFAELQGSYADYVTRFKSACLANDQLLHDKTMREAAKHFRSVKGAQRSRDGCQARLDEASTALQKLIRPALPQGSIPGPSYASA
ncbi:uncharacterized protein Triagg1_10878 [Trichoderma aggressivum f. europaeum]|uniref:Uncharacterized protein n=1 Tax=Trichoderma aggressivum f. europaeum TaxID=173218 RepID=A0AAE1IWD5_9HYPO|nr:hypothetical protein Triagg1_10878 [Trichoderma aggressivum f. europaeum]